MLKVVLYVKLLLWVLVLYEFFKTEIFFVLFVKWLKFCIVDFCTLFLWIFVLKMFIKESFLYRFWNVLRRVMVVILDAILFSGVFVWLLVFCFVTIFRDFRLENVISCSKLWFWKLLKFDGLIKNLMNLNINIFGFEIF